MFLALCLCTVLPALYHKRAPDGVALGESATKSVRFVAHLPPLLHMLALGFLDPISGLREEGCSGSLDGSTWCWEEALFHTRVAS